MAAPQRHISNKRGTTPEPTCPCGSGDSYTACCGRYIDTAVPAPDAQALMRSRYTAYTLRNEAYLLATWHRSARPGSLPLAANQKWLGLVVRAHAVDANNPDRATVEFVARSRVGGLGIRQHELSDFMREAGRWFYLDGSDVSAKAARR